MELAVDLLGFGVNLLAATALKTAEYLASKAKSAAMDKVPENRPMAKRVKSLVQGDIEQLKETLKKRLESLAQSNLRASIVFVKDALIIMECHNNKNTSDNDNNNDKTNSSTQTTGLIPANLDYEIPQESLDLLDQARNLSQLAWSDRENVSVPMRLEAMKIQLFCILLRYKDKPEACVGLISERIKALLDDSQLKAILDKKISRFFLFNKQSTLDAKNSVASFTRQLMCALPGMYKLGYRLREVPPFLTCLSSHACIPMGWWAGHPILCVNGSLLCDIPWTHKILVGDFDGTTKLLDLETLEFQDSYNVWLESNAIVDAELKLVYTNGNVLKWSDKKQTFKLNKDNAKSASYSRIESRLKCAPVISPSNHAVLLTEDGLYIRWSLEFADDNVAYHMQRTMPSDYKKCTQMYTKVDVDSVNDIKRLLWLQDGYHDDLFLYVLQFNADGNCPSPDLWRYQFCRDSKKISGSKLFTVPGANAETELDFYHDFLCWSDVNDALVAISLNSRSLFQFRLVELQSGKPFSHSVVWVKDFTTFPPSFNWRHVINGDDLQPNKVAEKMIYKRSPVMRDGCIFVCMPFEYALKQQQQQLAHMNEDNVKIYQPLGKIIG